MQQLLAPRTHVLIDTDPGTDDAMALALAVRAPGLRLVGVTTVGGNATLEDTTRNALAVLEALGRGDVPVARGAARRLGGEPYTYAYHFHGPGGLGIDLPPPSTQPVKASAAEFILQQARRYGSQLTLIALGPLTNLALALERDRAALAGLREIIVMGGALEVAGNIRPHAEFNIFNDPLAAARVLGSGLPVTLVPLDVCQQVCLSPDHLPALVGRGAAADLVARVLAGWLQRHPVETRYTLPDPLTVGVAVAPQLLQWHQATVAVERANPHLLGKTTARLESGSVRVPQAVDAAAFVELLVGTLVTGGGSSPNTLDDQGRG